MGLSPSAGTHCEVARQARPDPADSFLTLPAVLWVCSPDSAQEDSTFESGRQRTSVLDLMNEVTHGGLGGLEDAQELSVVFEFHSPGSLHCVTVTPVPGEMLSQEPVLNHKTA